MKEIREDYPYNIEFGDGRTKEEMDKMQEELMKCEMCNNNGTRREDNIYLCDECNETYPIQDEV